MSSLSSSWRQEADEPFLENQDSFRSNGSQREVIRNIGRASRISRASFKTLRKSIQVAFVGGVEDRSLEIDEECALLILFAKEGQETDVSSRISDWGLRCYQMRLQGKLFYRIAAWGLCFVGFFQRPYWTYHIPNDVWTNQMIYPSSGVPVIPFPVALILRTILILILAHSVFLECSYEGNTSRLFIVRLFIGLLVLKAIEVFIGVMTIILDIDPIITFSPVEALAILFVEKAFTNKLICLASIVPQYLIIIFLFGCAICSYTILGFIIFDPLSSVAQKYFDTYGIGVWNMLMILCTSNWPSPAIPAFEISRWYFLYYFIFLVLFNWGLLNLVLGVVYVLFDKQSIAVRSRLEKSRGINLTRAFDTLDVLRKGYLTYQETIPAVQIFLEDYSFGVSKPTNEELFALVKTLDSRIDKEDNDKGFITIIDFQYILEKCSAHALRVMRSEQYAERMIQSIANINPDKIASFSMSLSQLSMMSETDVKINALLKANNNSEELSFSQKEARSSKISIKDHTVIKKEFSARYLNDEVEEAKARWKEQFSDPLRAQLATWLDTKVFTVLMDTIILVFSIATLITFQNEGLTIFVFLLMVLECMIKIYVKGFYRYRKSYRNFIDGFLTLVLFIIISIYGSNGEFASGNQRFGIKVILLIRVIAYLRNIFLTRRFISFQRKYRRALDFALSEAVSFSFIFTVLLVFIYTFACIGANIFGGKIELQGENYTKLLQTPYGSLQYWPVNFNDIPSAMATMYILLLVNNTHVIAAGFVAVTSQWAEVFFVMWYVIGVLFILNLLTSAFLSECINFLHQYTIQVSNETAAAGLIKETNRLSDVSSTSSNVNLALSPSGSSSKNNNSFALDMSFDKSFDSTSASVDQLLNLSKSFSKSIFANDKRRKKLQERINNALAKQISFQNSVTLLAANHSYASSNQNSHSLLSQQRSSSIQLQLSRSYSRFDNTDVKALLLANDENKESIQHSSNSDQVSDYSQSQSFRRSSKRFSFLDNSGRFSMQQTIARFQELAATSILPFEKAAVCCQIAREYGQGMNNVFSSELALLCYRQSRRFKAVISFSVWLLIALRIFTRPGWTYFQEDWNNPEIYPMSEVPFLSDWLSLVIRLPLLLIIIAGLVLELGFESLEGNGKYLVIANLLLILYSIIQIILLCIAVASNRGYYIAWSTVFEELYIIWFNRRSREKIWIFIQIMPNLLALCSVLGSLILFFGIFGSYVHVYSRHSNEDLSGEKYFGSYADSLWAVYTSITSSSYPNQVMALYRWDRASFFYFFSFITIGSFGLLNLIFVTVLVKFESLLQFQSDERKANRNLYLLKAFEAMDTNDKGYLEMRDVKYLFDELYDHYKSFRKNGGIPDDDQKFMLISVLDIDEDKKISLQDFMFILDIMRLRIAEEEEVVIEETFIEKWFPSFTKTETFQWFKYYGEYKYTPLVFDILVIYLIIMEFSFAANFNLYAETAISDTIALIIYFVLLLECFILLCSQGFKKYLSQVKNIVDFFVIISLTIIYILFAQAEVNHIDREKLDIEITIKILECIRLLFFVRNIKYLMTNERAEKVGRIFLRLLRKLGSLFIAFYLIFSLFISLATLCFSGVISYTNPNIMTSNYGISNYYLLNFNDIPSSIVTLFSCLMVSDFDIIASGFVAATSKNARFFFLAWYIIGVLLMLNIVKSFFLSQFLKEVTTTIPIEKDIDIDVDTNSYDPNVLRESFALKNDLLMAIKRENLDVNDAFIQSMENISDSDNHVHKQYKISMSYVKDLDSSEKTILRNRLMHLSNSHKNLV